MTKKMRRVLSFLLALIMVAQYVPAGVFAAEEDNLCPHHTEHNAECYYEEGLHECHFECTQCTPEEPDQEPPKPSEEPTEPSEEPTKPSEEPTEPSEEPTKPSEEPTKPSEEPTKPSEEPTKPDAVCTCESEDADWHAPFCPLYTAPEKPECYCVEKCADGAVNEWCDVCYFDAAACAASGEEEGVPLDGTPVYIQSIAVAKDGSSGQTGINDCKNALQNAGYTVLNVDLNDGAGGDYIYMGYKTTTDPAEAIRGIIIRSGEYAPDTITYGNDGTFHKLGTYSEPNATGHGVVDLNSGCGSRSDYLYFYVTRSESYGAPVTELAFRTGNGNTSLDGFSVVTNTVYEAADANEGAGGSYIYLFEKRFSVDIVIQTYYFHTAYEGPKVTFYDTNYHFSDHTRTYNVYFNGLRQFDYNGANWTIAGFRDDDTIAAPNFKHGFQLTYQSEPYMVLRHVYSTTSTLSFDANGGTGAPASLSGTRYLIARKGSEAGETTLSLTIPADKPVWADKCAFLGWADSADATTAAYQPGDTYTLTSGNPTLYAVWQDHTGDTLCSNCGKSFAAPDQSNGVYQISNKEEMIWFMQHVNQGNRNASAVVTANIDMGGYIWTPIASTDSYHVSAVTDKGYTGTFDGAGHVISNFKINGGSGDGSSGASGNVKSYGLFGTVSGTVKNLGIRNFTFTVGSADCRAGGIAGQLLTGGRIENCCVTNSSITTDTRIAGGIAGCNYGGTIDRCYAYNNTVTGHSRCAAVVGDTVTDSGAPTKLTGTVTNCYADKNPVGSQNGGSAYVKNCGQLTADQFASGEATWRLNGSSASGAWKQTCGTGLPAFSGKTVYQVKRCDDVTVYSNESKNPQDHRYVNNVCTICGDVSSDAVAKVTFIGNNGTYYATLDDAMAAVADLDAGSEGVVQLLQDVPMGTGNLNIGAGVFTLDLNGKTLSCTNERIDTVSVSGTNTDVTICNGTISGGNSAVGFYDSGKVTLENVTLTAVFGITTDRNSEAILRSSVVNASTYGLQVDGGTVHVYDSSITGPAADVTVWNGSAVLHEGVSFPGGITVYYTTLNDVLAEGMAYWAGETMLYAAADATRITGKGDVTVKAGCSHEDGEKSYVNNGDNHIFTYSCCGMEVPEDHDYTETGICACGKTDPNAQATLSKDGKLVLVGTLETVMTEARKCAAADKAVVQLLQDVSMGKENLYIWAGVFTLDLNGKTLSSTAEDIGAVNVSGSNTDVTFRNGTISGGNNAVTPYDSGKVTLENVTLTGADGVNTSGNCEVIFRSSVVNASSYGLALHGGTVHVYDSVITGEASDISVQDGGAVLHEGVSFPGGITVYYTTLNDVLAEGMAYWAGETMLYAAADATEITDKGDVTVKAACSHEDGEKSYVNNGDDHIYTYSCCGMEVPEDHDYTETGICACGKTAPDAQATLSKDGKLVMAGTLAAVITKARECTAADKAVVQLLQDVPMEKENLHIWAGVVTLDLNGKTLSSTAEGIGAVNVSGSNTDVTIRNGTISGGNNAVGPYGSSKVTLENVTLTASFGISASGNCEVILRSSVVNASTNGLMLDGGTVHVYGSAITSVWADIRVMDSGAAFLHEDVSFPGGITVYNTTLNDVLAEGLAYWAGETMLYAAADATEITDKGDVTVKAACSHENVEKSYVNNGDNHICTYSCCGMEVPEDHDYTETGICACGKSDPNAEATLSKDGKLVLVGTLDAVITEARKCAAADKAVVQLLQDVPMEKENLHIWAGVFTLDLNGKTLSNTAKGIGAVNVSGSNTDVTIRNGIISGGNNAVCPYDSGKVTLENVTLTGVFGINTSGNCEVILRSGVVNASTYGLLLSGGTVHVYDSVITGEASDICVQDGGAVLYEGVSFPGGITVRDTTLNDVLAEGMAYWAGETMLYAAAEATEITDKGDVTVKAACSHENVEKSYVNNGDNHICTYSCCGMEVPEDHDYTETGICACGKAAPDVQATLSKDGKLIMTGTLDAVITEAQKCTAADKAVVQLQQSVEDGAAIYGGVFTLDLNGKDISSDTHALDVGSGAELVITDSSAVPGTIRAGENAFSIWQSSGKVTIEKGNFFGQLYVSGGILTMVDGYVEAALDEPLYNNGGEVRLQGGALQANNVGWIRSNAGKVTVSGSPVFAGSTTGETFRLCGGTMDLSGMADPSGLTLWNDSGTAVPVSDVLLPEGYFFWWGGTAAEDTLLNNQAYTISQTEPDGPDADQVQINLYLKPVNQEGNEIQGALDVALNNSAWIGTESMDYGYATVNIGENILSYWDNYPDGYLRPTEDITFTYDVENGITITSGNAAAEQVGDSWYIVVTLITSEAYPQAPENGWPIWVAGTVVTADNCEDILGDGTVSYDPETETLTFQDAYIEAAGYAILKSEMPLTVNILGENEFYSDDTGEYDYGFWFDYEEGTTEITGTGSVDIWSDDECIQMDGEDVELILSGSVEIMADPAYSSAVAIDVESVVASMTVQDAVHLTIGSESSKHKDEAIYIGTQGTTHGSMTIQDDAVITIYTSDEEGIYVGGDQEQELTITGGTVYIEADEEALDANTITISGGNITAIGGVEYEGIFANDLTITGGSVLVGCGDDGQAIEAKDITITGGTVRALNGGMIAVTVDGETGERVPGTITLGEGMIISEPEGAEIGELTVEGVDDITGEPVTEEVKTIVNADGVYADAFVITDGETELPKLAELWLAGVAMEDGDYLAVNARATSDTKPAEGGYAYYEDGILTLHDYTFEGEGYFHDGDSYAALYCKNDLELVLEGENILNCVTDEDMDAKGARISGSLVVSGTGSLELSGEGYGLYIGGGFTMNGGKMTVTGDRRYGIRIALDIVINGGHLIAGSENAFGLDSYEGNLTITGGTLEITKGGMDLPQYFDEMGEPATGIVTLGEGVGVTVPEGGQISTLFHEENYMYNTTVVDADGVPADAFVITDGKEPAPVYSGWTEMEGDWYYYDPETNEAVTGIARVPYPDVQIGGITYAPNAEDMAFEGENFLDAEQAWFLFDDNGVFQSGVTGMGSYMDAIRYVQNGFLPWHPGMLQAEGEYYYFIGDETNGGNILATGDVYVKRNTTKRDFAIGGVYTFGAEGKLCEYDGITEVNGVKRYYVDAQLMMGNGLTAVDKNFIYVDRDGELVVDAYYWVSANELEIVEGIYYFDGSGYLQAPQSTDKEGVYFENNNWYYYVEGVKQTNKGLISVEDVIWHLTDGTEEAKSGIIYVKANGALATGNYWVTTITNYKGDDVKSGDLLNFDDLGLRAGLKNGLSEENGILYFYKNGIKGYNAGVTVIDGKYYYVKSNAEVVRSRDYWITNVGDTGVIAQRYTFAADGTFEPKFRADAENGIVDGYYYVDGEIQYAAGVVYLEEEGCYIYVRSNGQIATGIYWATNTNGLLESKSYDWGESGKLYL